MRFTSTAITSHQRAQMADALANAKAARVMYAILKDKRLARYAEEWCNQARLMRLSEEPRQAKARRLRDARQMFDGFCYVGDWATANKDDFRAIVKAIERRKSRVRGHGGKAEYARGVRAYDQGDKVAAKRILARWACARLEAATPPYYVRQALISAVGSLDAADMFGDAMFTVDRGDMLASLRRACAR